MTRFPFFIAFVFFILLVTATPERIRAQELDAQVDINLQVLSDMERLNFITFKRDLENYINGNAWTSDFSGSRIHCNFQVNIIASNGSDYTAQLFVTSKRPLYKSEEVSTMARFFDQKVDFPYIRGQDFVHGNNYRPLESIIDYYVYVILGLDYDSYKLYAGTPLFQQAMQIAVIGNSASGLGWERTITAIGTYSRLGYIENLMDANQRAFRDLMFHYNYDVLDLETTKPDQARNELAVVIDSMVSLKRENSFAQRSPFFRTWFEAKYPELADLARFFPDNLNAYFEKLIYLDPLHETYYEDIKKKMQQ